MREVRLQSALSVLLLLVFQWQSTSASPLLLNETELVKRQCPHPCGYQGWMCCNENQHCSYLSDGEPTCVNGEASSSSSSSSSWEYHTTTVVETDVATSTSIWSSLVTPTEAACRADIGETQCGGRCCEAAFECVDNQCVQGSSSAAIPTAAPTSGPISSATASATPSSSTGAGGGGSTEPNGEGGSSDGGVTTSAKGSTNHLSGGAIAGIVVGIVAGLFLLGFCLFCVAGRRRGRRRTRTETVIVEKRRGNRRYSGGSGGRRYSGGGAGEYYGSGTGPWRRTWFGTRPSTVVDERRRSGSRRHGHGWAWIGVFFAAIAVCLGLRRRDRRNRRDDQSTSSYTYDSNDYYTNPCEYPQSPPFSLSVCQSISDSFVS